MSVTQINGNAVTATSTDNNHGRIMNGGNIGNTSLWTKINVGGPDIFFGGSKIVTSNQVSKAWSSGTFAYIAAGKFIIPLVTTTIAGVASDVIRIPAAEPAHGRRSIHSRTDNLGCLVATAIRTGAWNNYSGLFDSGSPLVQNASFGADNAVTSRSSPGELVYMEGDTLPTQDDYDAKTGG